MPTPAELLAQSLAKFQTANRIDGTKNSYRKDSPNEYAAVMAYLNGGPRPNATSDMGMALVFEEDARRALLAGPVEPPPGDVAYPASYRNGPLGANNPLPSKDGAFLGVWGPGMAGGATTWEQQLQLTAKRQADMGRKYDIIMTVDTNSSDQAQNRCPWIHSNGSIPAVHLGAGLSHSTVLSGGHDALLDSLAARWGGYDFVVMVRLFHEFEAATSYYGLGNPTQFVQSWRYIVDRFKSKGADNVGWWWCPGEGFGGNRDAGFKCYPGDAYVDWVGSDAYNWVRHNEDKYATPWTPGWATFKQILDYDDIPPGNPASVHRTKGPSKPFIVGETGCTFDNQAGYEPTKGQWYRDVVTHAKTMDYLRGVCWFDVDASSETAGDSYPKRNDWRAERLESIPSIYQGYIAMAKDPYFNTRA